MEQSVRVITLGVDDLARSRAFYTRGLGWTPLLDLDDVVFYQVGFGLVLALWPRRELAADSGAAIGGGRSFALGHNVDSRATVDDVIRQVIAAGGEVVKEPRDAPLFGGYQGYFADPDGHLWEVAYNPNLRVEGDGTLHFGTPS